MKYRRKPIVIDIDAIQFTQKNVEVIDEWISSMGTRDFGWQGDGSGATRTLIVQTLEGPHIIPEGHWIICGITRASEEKP